MVFADAHSVGLDDELELLALRRSAAALATVPGYVAMNVSPATLLTPKVRRFLSRAPLHRVVLELSEHDQIEDYDALLAALAPLRAAGMRLTIVAGVSEDGVLTTLVRSLVDFAAGCGATEDRRGHRDRCRRPLRWVTSACSTARVGCSAGPAPPTRCASATRCPPLPAELLAARDQSRCRR